MRQTALHIDLQTVVPATGGQTPLLARRRLVTAFTICYISILFSGIATLLMSIYLPVAVRDLLGAVTGEEIHTISAYINSIFIFGTMFGGFIWGFICDRIGRSKAVTYSTALYGIFSVLTAFSQSWILVGVYRFVTGFGIGGVLVTTNILIAEMWPEKKRAIALGIVSAAMPVGFIVAGALNNLMPEWRHAFLMGIVPVITALIAFFTLAEPGLRNPERPLSHGKLRTQMFSGSNKDGLIHGSLIFGTMLIGLWAVFSWTPTWVQSITPDSARADELRGTTMMVLSFSGLTGSIVSGWVVNRAGMSKTMMMCFGMSFIMTAVVFKLNTSITYVTLAEMSVLAFFFGISQGALSVYIPSLFPGKVRASATGFCFNVGRLFTATVVFFIGALVTLLGGYGNAVFIFSFIFLIGLVVIFLSNRGYEAKWESIPTNGS